MNNIYQHKRSDASHPPVMPAEVLVSLREIAESAKEGLLALAVGTGMQVMYAMMDTDVTALAGPKGKHNPDRAAVRHGHEDCSMAADLSGLDLVALMVDGVGFAEHLCVVALGIGIDGTKHPLALVEGSTENATLDLHLPYPLDQRQTVA